MEDIYGFYEGIYMIRNKNTNYVKVGMTNNIYRRFRELQTQSGCDLWVEGFFENYLIDSIPTRIFESKIHEKYKKYRIVGEWFNFDNETFHKCYEDIDTLLELDEFAH